MPMWPFLLMYAWSWEMLPFYIFMTWMFSMRKSVLDQLWGMILTHRRLQRNPQADRRITIPQRRSSYRLVELKNMTHSRWKAQGHVHLHIHRGFAYWLQNEHSVPRLVIFKKIYSFYLKCRNAESVLWQVTVFKMWLILHS